MNLILRGVNIWNGTDDHISSDQEILIETGKILEVRPASTGNSGDTRVIDLQGAYVTPGLIDMHVHLVWDGSSDPASVVERDGEQLTTLRAIDHGLQELRAGVTTVRDLGGNWNVPLAVAKAIRARYLPGPNVIAAGKTVIMTGGHDPFWGEMADGEVALTAAVRRQAYLGAQCIKVAATGGVYGRPDGEEIGQSELTFEELRAVATEAHRLNLKVAAHALGREGIHAAVRAGIDTIEHGTFLDEAIINDMLQAGTALCPTLLVYRTIAEGAQHGIPAYAVEKAQRAVDAHRTSFQAALKAGVHIVAGSDAGSPATPHGALIDELLLMHESGMDAAAALRSATSGAAHTLGLGRRLGQIAPGFTADLVVYGENPITQLTALRSPQLVVSRGQTVVTDGPDS
ncbi:amidohydrolase family protein [Deinococcus sp. SM5_A1]|uniref:metal-dependent hydrolase family protein n=1 Tax=Deinococcus sp. SM5_A1 TaxID=3379094 RepID=UPI0038583B25